MHAVLVIHLIMIHYSTLRINTAYYEASESLRLGPSWSLMSVAIIQGKTLKYLGT
jgi:hypothetical protein